MAKARSLVHKLTGIGTNVRTRTSIERFGLHYEDPIVSMINHSCQPNCEWDGMHLIALVDFDGEPTFNYLKTESDISHPFDCWCCGRRIDGNTNKNTTAST